MGIGSCGWLELAAAADAACGNGLRSLLVAMHLAMHVRYMHLRYMQGMHLMYDI